jgi:hypothetical protein
MIGIDLNCKVVAGTRNKILLDQFESRNVDRFYSGIYLPHDPENENFFLIPKEWDRRDGIYLEVTFPVNNDIVACAINRNCQEISPTPDKRFVSNLAKQSFIARGRMAIMVMKREKEVAYCTFRIIEVKEHTSGKLYVDGVRIYQRKAPLSADGKIIFKNFLIEKDQELGDILSRMMIDAINTLNDIRAIPAAISNGNTKRVISLGVAAKT